MTKLFKLLMFISSYFPLYIILIFTILPFENLRWTEILGNKKLFIVIIVLIILLVISFIPLIYIFVCERNSMIEAKSVKQMNSETLSYLVTYIVPMLAIDINEIKTLVANALLFLLIGYLYIRSNLLHINILFLIFGWNIYEDTSKRIIISREKPDYFKREEVSNHNIKVRHIGSKIYLHKK